ncbi:MAG: TonB-dependent receptor [Cytophagaceae bacterium]|nr:TonB-dependent receptor [Cytophagaceae bacterium]
MLAATIKGHIKDANNGDPLIEAIVTIKDSESHGFTDFEGNYVIKDLALGNYTLSVSYLGYITQEQFISITEANGLYKVNFELPEKSEIITVEVLGSADKESDKYALNQEKNADNISNVLSAKTIQLLPDITIGAVLQRVSGVSLERTSTGDARYAIIRGMDQRYNYTLVNGIKIPSPDNKYRYVPMDMFPADIIERLEVSKSLTPSMEGDAIGGAMNLVMKDAPEHFTVTANVGSGASKLLADRGYTNFDKKVVSMQSPSEVHGAGYVTTPSDFTYKNFDYTTKKLPLNGILGFTVGGRFLKDKKMGFIVAATYQNVYRGSNSIWFKPDNLPALGNKPTFVDIYVRQYNSNQTRYAIHNKIDYKLNDKHKISLYNMLMKLDEVQYRHTIDTNFTANRSGPGTGNIYELDRSRITNQSIYNSTLHGDHVLSNSLQLNWSGVYSIAKSITPDWSEIKKVHFITPDSTSPPVIDIPFYRIWTKNTDRDWSGYLNLSYHRSLFGQDITLSIGGLYRDKLRNNFYNEWDLVPKTSSQGTPVIYNGHLSPDLFQFNGTSAAQGSLVNPLTYTATEKILAYYIQAKIILYKRLEIIGGTRIENTTQGWRTAQDPKLSYGVVGTVPYTDVLPSINFKYRLTEKQNLRLSYFAAINRPGFGEYIPFTVSDDNWPISGNPNLKHATSNNFDIRYEYFPKGLDQFLVGAFYKTIANPIETAVVITSTSGASAQPSNFGTATNFGFELSFTKFLGKYGVSGNYTYTHSAITTSKLYYDNYISTNVSQTRPLQGQSPHIANLSLLYKNKSLGLDLQLALVYTGKKIVYISPYKDLDYWQRGMYQLDFSIEKRFFKYFTAYCKVNNILNTPVVVEILQDNNYKTAFFDKRSDSKFTVQKDYYGQSLIAGIRFKI